jgi:hypothetical protein
MKNSTEIPAAMALEKCTLFSRKLAGFKRSMANRKENNRGNKTLFPMITRKPNPIRIMRAQANLM